MLINVKFNERKRKINIGFDENKSGLAMKFQHYQRRQDRKVFTTTYNSLFASNIFDDFVANGMDGATVKVKAYGDGDKFNLWSDEVTVSRFDF